NKLFIDLPAGVIGDPLALPHCSRAAFDFNLATTCPGNTQVGIADIEANQGRLVIHPGGYNLTPPPRSPVTRGLMIDNNTARFDAALRTGADYGPTVGDLAVPTREEFQSVVTHIWGLPMAKSHDESRYCIPEDPELGQIEGCSSDSLPTP